MPVIPALHSLVTHVHDCPAPGGRKNMTITYGVPNGPSDVLAEALHEVYNDVIWTVLGHQQSSLVETIVRDEFNAGSYAEVHVGGNTNEALPPNTALLVRKNTGVIGRANRGRMYLPYMLYENTILNNGTMDGTTRTSYQEHFDDWLVAINESIATGMVILHSTEAAPTEVTSLVVDGTIATQRRRLR